MLCVKFGWNWPSGSGEEDENVKSLQTDGQTDGQTDRQTDDARQVIRKAHLSFQLRWAKKVIFFFTNSCLKSINSDRSLPSQKLENGKDFSEKSQGLLFSRVWENVSGMNTFQKKSQICNNNKKPSKTNLSLRKINIWWHALVRITQNFWETSNLKKSRAALMTPGLYAM